MTCLVHTPRGVDADLGRHICGIVRRLASAAGPLPVTESDLGGPMLSPSRLTLLVHANVAPIAGRDVMALSIRPYRNDAEAGQFFAAPPRAVAADDPAALEAAVRAILAETIPGTPPGARPIR